MRLGGKVRVDPPRRRRRHRLLPTRGDGDRVRWDGGGSEADRAGAVERPGRAAWCGMRMRGIPTRWLAQRSLGCSC